MKQADKIVERERERESTTNVEHKFVLTRIAVIERDIYDAPIGATTEKTANDNDMVEEEVLTSAAEIRADSHTVIKTSKKHP